MKSRILLFAATSILILAILACGPVTVTPSNPSPISPVPAAASSTPKPTAATTDTVPAPTLETFPPALAHYRTGDPIQLDQIKMTSLTEGWSLSGPYVLVTADGGLTWREVTPPETIAGGAPDKVYGAFLDRQTAWVIFSQGDQIFPEQSVWATKDGGVSWTRSAPLFHQISGDTMRAEFAAPDAEHAWLMLFAVYLGAGTHYNNQLFSSADGGLSWIMPYRGDVNWGYTGMVFSDANTGWLTWATTGAYAADPPNYAVTTDGGASWETRELPPPSDAPGIFDEYDYCEPYQPVLISSQAVWMLLGCTGSQRADVSYLYASQDGGATWETVLLPDKVQPSSATLLYFDAGHALLLGRDIYRSTDSGQTWAHVATVNWDGQFSFVDPQHGWGVVHSDQGTALVKTVDGSTSWTMLRPVIAP